MKYHKKIITDQKCRDLFKSDQKHRWHDYQFIKCFNKLFSTPEVNIKIQKTVVVLSKKYKLIKTLLILHSKGL